MPTQEWALWCAERAQVTSDPELRMQLMEAADEGPSALPEVIRVENVYTTMTAAMMPQEDKKKCR